MTGAVGLVAAPISGAKTGGVQGFFMGLASGLFTAVTLPVAGAAVATYQVGRGAINSVEGVSELVMAALRQVAPRPSGLSPRAAPRAPGSTRRTARRRVSHYVILP